MRASLSAKELATNVCAENVPVDSDSNRPVPATKSVVLKYVVERLLMEPVKSDRDPVETVLNCADADSIVFVVTDAVASVATCNVPVDSVFA